MDRAAPTPFSVQDEFKGARVLLTGATGYVGSVVLEQLLRCTDVGTVYCLVRGKAGASPQQRLDKVLHSTLFHKVRDTAAILRARAVGGDLTLPQLGLSEEDRSLLQSEVNIVLHCAADIVLAQDIQKTLRANVQGALAVMALARSCSQLRGMVHVSSAYVNMNLPTSSIVHERMYPLVHGGQEVCAKELVVELLGYKDPASANIRARSLIKRYGFPNTYTFGKHLGEKVLAAEVAAHPLPFAIVRPSLICSIALEPLPGYTGNMAGPNGICAALTLGLYDSLKSLPFTPHHSWDLIPADFVGSTILAAAAAESAAWSARAVSTRVSNALPSMPVSSLADGHMPLATIKSGEGWCPDIHQLPDDWPQGDQCIGTAPAAPSVCSTSESEASSLRRSSGPASSSLQDGDNGSEACSTPAASSVPPVPIYHAALGSLGFVTLQEGWSYWRSFIQRNPPPFRLSWGLPGNIPDDFVPDPAAVAARLRWVRLKVSVAAKLLRLCGKGAAANKLRSGVISFGVLNNDDLDRDLTFVVANTQRMARQLKASDAATFPFVCKPSGIPCHPDGSLAEECDLLCAARLTMTPAEYADLMMAGVYYRLFGMKVNVQ